MPFLFFIIAFMCTVLALVVGRRIALRFGFADQPGGRKKHEEPVPPIGGLVILPVFLLTVWVSGFQSFLPWPLVAGILVLLVMGMVDDMFGLKSLTKLTVMVWTACFVVIFGHAQIAQVGNLFGFGLVELGLFSKPFSIMCLVLLMNAINMMDGVDGLAGGFCALMSFWLMVACAGAGQWVPFWALSFLLAPLIGFLCFNLRSPFRARASVFLGDAGSLSLGLLLGWFSIQLTQGAVVPVQPITVIWIIALPVMDAFALFIARSLRGLHPFHADRRHLHHRFVDAGISPARTTALMLALVAFMAMIGFVAQANNVPPVILFGLWMFLFVAHTAAIMHPKGYTLFSRFIRMHTRPRQSP